MEGTGNNRRSKSNYKKFLNEKDPMDKQIIELVEKGELKVAIVEVPEVHDQESDKYSYKHLPHRGKHTS